MQRQGISIFIIVLAWILLIGGIIGTIILALMERDNTMTSYIVTVGILSSLISFALLAGLAAIIDNTYNTYLETSKTNAWIRSAIKNLKQGNPK